MVGHARLWKVVGHADAALVESVVVTPELRGRGLGRRLMELSEQHARGCDENRQFYSSSSSSSSSPSPAGWAV